MIEYLDVDDKNVYISTYRRKLSWIEVPKGTEVITGDRFDKYSLVFWKPSIGEVWNHNRFAKYVLQDSVSYEEYVDRWTNDPVVWKRPEQTTLESLVNSVETYVSLLHDNVVQVVKSLRSGV